MNRRRSPQPRKGALTPEATETHDPRLVALVRELAYQAAEEDHLAEIQQRQRDRDERAA